MRIHLILFPVLIFTISVSGNDLFSTVFHANVSPIFLGQMNSLIEAFIMGRFEVKQLNNEKLISFQSLSRQAHPCVVRLEAAQSVLFAIHARIESMKRLNMNIRPKFILDRAGNISPSVVNMSQIQVLRLSDFMRNKMFISDEKLINFNNNISAFSDDEKKQKIYRFEIGVTLIHINHVKYIQSFFQGNMTELEKAMQKKVDWEYMPLHRYHSKMNKQLHEASIERGVSLLKDVIARNHIQD